MLDICVCTSCTTDRGFSPSESRAMTAASAAKVSCRGVWTGWAAHVTVGALGSALGPGVRVTWAVPEACRLTLMLKRAGAVVSPFDACGSASG